MSVRGKRLRNGVVRWTLVWTLVLALVMPLQAEAAVASGVTGNGLQKKVVVVLIDGLQMADITTEQTPNLWKLQQLGAVGVMNQNTLGARDEVNSYLTIGAGTKASAPFPRAEAYGVHDRVKEEGHVVTGRDLYMRDIGSEPTGRIVVPQLPMIEEQVAKSRYTIVPGALGFPFFAARS
ncbi:MAG: hypothetical protein ACXVP5_12855 [Tumebacillaceae bacterium]